MKKEETNMKVGFTGTQKGASRFQFESLMSVIRKLQPTEAHHGMCIGADEEFHFLIDMERKLGRIPSNCKIIGHPPINKSKMVKLECDEYREPKDYLVRNKDIVDESDILIGCPEGEEVLRSGTWSTIRYCRKQKKEVIVIPREKVSQPIGIEEIK